MTACAFCGNEIDFHSEAQKTVCLKRLSKDMLNFRRKP